MFDPAPIRLLKPEDSAALPDPETLGATLMEMLRQIHRDALDLRTALSEGRALRSVNRSVDLCNDAALARETGETLMKSYRQRGVFSADLGV